MSYPEQDLAAEKAYRGLVGGGIPTAGFLGPQNITASPKEMGPIQSEGVRLASCIDRMGMVVSQLREKLGPTLRATPPMNSVASDTSASSPLGMFLAAQAERANVITASLLDILRAVEV